MTLCDEAFRLGVHGTAIDVKTLLGNKSWAVAGAAHMPSAQTDQEIVRTRGRRKDGGGEGGKEARLWSRYGRSRRGRHQWVEMPRVQFESGREVVFIDHQMIQT